MKLTLLASVLLGSLFLNSCGGGTTPPVVEPPLAPALIGGTVNLGITVDGIPSAFHTNAEGAGRTLNVRAGSPIISQSLIRQALSSQQTLSSHRGLLRAQATNGAVIASSQIGSSLTYSLPNIAPLNDTLEGFAGLWPEGAGVSCTRTTDLLSDPAARVGGVFFELAPGGNVDHSDLLLSSQVRSSETAFLVTFNELIYADRDVTRVAQGTCTSLVEGQTLTVEVDINQTLRQGWNVVISSTSAEATGATSFSARTVGRASTSGSLTLNSLD